MGTLEVTSHVALIATPIVIAIGFWFARKQLMCNKNANMSEIILDISARWQSAEMERSRRVIRENKERLGETIVTAYESDTQEQYYDLVRVADFFDALGLMVVEGFLDRKIAYSMFGEVEKVYFDWYRPIFEAPKPHFGVYLKYFKSLHDVFEPMERATPRKWWQRFKKA